MNMATAHGVFICVPWKKYTQEKTSRVPLFGVLGQRADLIVLDLSGNRALSPRQMTTD
jgi:hypothetical protein